MVEQILPQFHNVLMICDELPLIGGDIFAIDGCKLPGNRLTITPALLSMEVKTVNWDATRLQQSLIE